jgi:hypothetical protein
VNTNYGERIGQLRISLRRTGELNPHLVLFIVRRSPALVFTELILQILNRIYEIAIHGCVFILDLPTNIDL